MAEALRFKVRCFVCNQVLEGTAKYGKGHYTPEGLDFHLTAIGRKRDKRTGKIRVLIEVKVVCPYCGVENKYRID